MPAESLYRQYRAELNGDKLADSARVGVLVVVALNTAFIALDWWTQSERFRELLTVRLFWDAAMGAVYWGLRFRNPLLVMLLGLYLTGAGMLSVIGLAGGLTSAYWPGMMILFLGIPVMLPLSVRQASLVVALLSAGFVGLPLMTGEEATVAAFLPPVFFVLGAAVECVASTAALERLRLQDFAQRREIEKARDHLREMDRVKARFTANVHHELRTPLTLTLAPVEGLLSGEFGPLGDQQRSYLRTVHANALRLLNLINDLLDLAKIESKQLEVHRRPVDVAKIASQLVEGAQPLSEKKGLRLALAAESDVPVVNADPGAIEKALLNLLGNALKFTPGGGRIDVFVKREGDGARIDVRDSGVGLAEEQLERIFDRFAQVDSSATRKHEGTGIGLSLTKELVELHGGRVWAESPGPGKGATVSIWLPVGEQDEVVDAAIVEEGKHNDELMPDSSLSSNSQTRLAEIERRHDRSVGWGGDAAQDPRANQRRATVLICEDNPEMRRLLADLVRKEFSVRVASNGREGLEAVENQQPDLVLTDVMMPEMSGIELCAALKENPETSGIPVVLVTSKAERDMKIEGLEQGADDYVTKPFHARELLARVRSLVKLRMMSADLESQNEALEQANSDLGKALSDLKNAETQVVHAERLAAVGELAAGLAHEVNNPVNFALNASRTLSTYVADLRESLRRVETVAGVAEAADGIEELSSIISEGLQRTSRLVGSLRDLAAPGAGDRSAVDLGQVVDSALQLTRYYLEKSGVVVDFRVDRDLAVVHGDHRALGQVVLNVLKNAAEAFETEGGRVEISVRNKDSGVLIEIGDNGPGISADVRAHVFEPFVSTKAAGMGTGLGLSISKRVVDEHRGTISVESLVGEGTKFSVWLPAEENE